MSGGTEREGPMRTRALGRMRLYVALCLFALGALAGLSVPSIASAATPTLSTQPATGVGIVSATLHGTASGFPESDYCSFDYENPELHPSLVENEPAQPCDGEYSVKLTGLQANTTYMFFAVACGKTTEKEGKTYCIEEESIAVDPCSFERPSTCPTFTTGVPTGKTTAATLVRGTSATLNATLNIYDMTAAASGVGSDKVEYSFEYSTDPALSAATATAPTLLPELEESEPAVSAAITGLTPATTYYYRVLVSAPENGARTPYKGNIESFTTGGYARTEPATAVSGSGATLNGEVSAGDSSLEYHWLYSTSKATSGSGVLDSGAQSTSGGTVQPGEVKQVSGSATGLSPASTYYFQLVTSEPSIHGEVLSFSTSSPCAHTSYSSKAIAGTGFVLSGCFSQEGTDYTGYGGVSINGLSLSGPSGATIELETADKKIVLRDEYGISVGSTLLSDYSSEVSLSYENKASDGETRSEVQVLADPTAKLFGFPMLGNVTITADSKGGSSIEIAALGMPALFGGVTAEGTASVSQEGALSALHAQIGQAMLGPVELPHISLEYEASTDKWRGEADLMFPLAKAGVSVKVGIENDKLNELGGAYSGPPSIPLGDTGVELSGLGFNTVFEPLTLEGSLELTAGPKIGDFSALSINAEFYAGFNQNQTLTGLPGVPEGTVLQDVPFTLGIGGRLSLLGFIELASAELHYYGIEPLPFVALKASTGPALLAKCGPVFKLGVEPKFGIAGDALATQFNVVGEGGATVYLCGAPIKIGMQAVLSTRGAAFCGEADGNSVGVGIRWPTSFSSLKDILKDIALYESGCNIEPYEQPINFGSYATAAQAASVHGARRPVLRLPGGLPFAVMKVKGRGAPPLLTLRGPHGLRIAMSSAHGLTVARKRYLVIPDALNDTTYVELTRPPRGAYRIQAEHGSAAIESVRIAHGLRKPSIHAGVSGRGGKRVLRWQARSLHGRRLVLREFGAGGERRLVATTKAKGRLRFSPRPGVKGRRFVIAEVYERGMLTSERRVAAFNGPVISTPKRPAHLKATRRGRKLIATWRGGGASASRFSVLVSYPDGARRLYLSRSHKLVLHGVPARGPMSVTVTALNALGARSGSVKAKVTRAAQVHKRTGKRHRRHARRHRASRHRARRHR